MYKNFPNLRKQAKQNCVGNIQAYIMAKINNMNAHAWTFEGLGEVAQAPGKYVQIVGLPLPHVQALSGRLVSFISCIIYWNGKIALKGL